MIGVHNRKYFLYSIWMRILLVEDNDELGRGLKTLLGGSYSVDLVQNGEDALSATASFDYDLVVLDLSLPDMDGLGVLKDMRANRIFVPVLILTARDSSNDRVIGLDLGADDYLTKPFDMNELEARVRALLRRTSIEKTSQLQIGGLSFNLKNGMVSAGDRMLDLSVRETEVLRALMLANGRLISKARLLEAITSFQDDVTENAVEQYVSRLRKKILPHGVSIHAARGLGYHISDAN